MRLAAGLAASVLVLVSAVTDLRYGRHGELRWEACSAIAPVRRVGGGPRGLHKDAFLARRLCRSTSGPAAASAGGVLLERLPPIARRTLSAWFSRLGCGRPALPAQPRRRRRRRQRGVAASTDCATPLMTWTGTYAASFTLRGDDVVESTGPAFAAMATIRSPAWRARGARKRHRLRRSRPPAVRAAGGPGNDNLRGEQVYGGPGNDRLFAGAFDSNMLVGGPGRDVVVLTARMAATSSGCAAAVLTGCVCPGTNKGTWRSSTAATVSAPAARRPRCCSPDAPLSLPVTSRRSGDPQDRGPRCLTFP